MLASRWASGMWCSCRIPDGTSHLLNDLLIKLLKKIPKERIGHGECTYMCVKPVTIRVGVA